MANETFVVRADLLRDLCVTARREAPRELAGVAQFVEDQLAHATSAWLPGALFVSFHEEALAVLGEVRLIEVCRSSVELTADNAILRKVVALARKMTGGRPAALLRWFPPARSMLVRGGGDAFFVDTPRGARIDIRGLPAALVEARAWRIGTAGALQGIIQLGGGVGEVTLEDDAGDPAAATFQLRW